MVAGLFRHLFPSGRSDPGEGEPASKRGCRSPLECAPEVLSPQGEFKSGREIAICAFMV